MPTRNDDTPAAPLIECLRAGRHVDVSGRVVEFSQADLQAIASSYDPAAHEAPIVVGHPRMDAPAYGWAARFEAHGNVLRAVPQQVEPQFAELVNQGRFKKVSMALYGPDHPANPKPGTWYPKHVGFLGAMPPAIKGLKSVAFSEADEAGVYVFGEELAIGVFRRLREWLIAKFGADEADRVIPGYELDWAQQQAAEERVQERDEAAALPAFSEAATDTPPPNDPTSEDAVSQTQITQLQEQLDQTSQALATANAELATLRRLEAEAKQAALRSEATAFAEQLISQARQPEERRGEIVEMYLALATPGANGQPLMFGEGDAAKPLIDAFKASLMTAAPAVQFGEHATTRAAGAAAVSAGHDELQFSEANTDAGRLALHRRVLAIQQAEPELSYQAALEKAKRG